MLHVYFTYVSRTFDVCLTERMTDCGEFCPQNEMRRFWNIGLRGWLFVVILRKNVRGDYWLNNGV